MKKFSILLTILVISTTLFAQIPNAGFENWSGGEPIGWVAVEGPGSIIQSTDYHSGSYAAKLVPEVEFGIVLAPSIATINADDNSAYFPIGTTPVSYTGWYILNTVDSDNLLVGATVKTNIKTDSGYILSHIFTPTSTYKQFAYNFLYIGSGIADSAALTFWLFSKAGTPLGVDSNDYFIVDDLAFSQSQAGIDEVNKAVAVLEPCSPNPAITAANIIYSIPTYSTVTVELYDVMGRKLETLLTNSNQSPGRYKIPTDVSRLSSGIYFFTLTANGQTYTQKLTVTH